jgi:colanic acid biosynthesis protein WcaH
MVSKLTKEDFYLVIEKTPLVSVDFFITTKDNKVLLGYRNNDPAYGTYFTPGGVIYKNEIINDSIRRVLKNEIGLDYELLKKYITFNKVYTHIYPNNFKDNIFSTHYVCLSYHIKLPLNSYEYIINPQDEQHDKIVWYDYDYILKSNSVHHYVKEMVSDYLK